MFDIYCCEEHSATDYKGAATIVRITLLSSREYCDRVLESLPAVKLQFIWELLLLLHCSKQASNVRWFM